MKKTPTKNSSNLQSYLPKFFLKEPHKNNQTHALEIIAYLERA